MDQAFIVDFAMDSIKTTLLLSAPMLGIWSYYGVVGIYFSGGYFDSRVDADLHSKDSCCFLVVDYFLSVAS